MAKEKGLTYVKLGGNIGILGNGAGLCMSTLDVVAQAGGKPANFLDAGGGSKADAIVDALEVITSDENVNAILFNIFGGITRCDEIAKGIIEASAQDRDRRAAGRPPRRHQLRGGAGAARRGRASRPARGEDDARRRRAGRRARRAADGDHRRRATRSSSISGLTGREGSFHGLRNRDYGTDLVAGVTPGKGGQDVEGIPVFDTIAEAVAERGANTSMIFVPARFAAAAIERGDRRRRRHGDRDHRGDPGLRHAARLLEGEGGRRPPDRPQLPRRALARQVERRDHPGAVLRPRLDRGRLEVGHAHLPDRQRAEAGRASATRRSSASAATRSSARTSSTSSPCSRQDDETELIVMVGEIGGDAEERAADFIAEQVSKPVVAYIAGFTAPPGKQMGHAGAIISGSSGTAEAKKEALEARGVRVGRSPTEAAQLAVEAIGARA